MGFELFESLSSGHSHCVTIPPRPLVTSTSSKPFHFLAGDHLVVPIGVSHISSRLQKYNQESGRKKNKEQTRVWVNSKCKKGDSVTLCIPLCICRLTLAWISSDIIYKASRNANPSWPVFPHCCWTLSPPTGLSAVRCRLPTRVTLRQLPSLSSFVQLLDSRFLAYVRSRPRSRVLTLCQVSRQNRQRDRLLGGPPT